MGGEIRDATAAEAIDAMGAEGAVTSVAGVAGGTDMRTGPGGLSTGNGKDGCVTEVGTAVETTMERALRGGWTIETGAGTVLACGVDVAKGSTAQGPQRGAAFSGDDGGRKVKGDGRGSCGNAVGEFAPHPHPTLPLALPAPAAPPPPAPAAPPPLAPAAPSLLAPAAPQPLSALPLPRHPLQPLSLLLQRSPRP